MNLSAQQQQILSEIGIPVWRLRTETTNNIESDGIAVEQGSSADSEVDLSTAVWLVLENTQLNDAEQRLLNAMLKAIGLDINGVSILTQDQISTLAETQLHGKTILLLAETDTPELNRAKPEMVKQANDSQWIATYSLKEMMTNTALKAVVWQALKLLKLAS